MTNCVFCQKKILLKFIMNVYNLKATEIAKEINVSDSLVRKHIDGVRNCQSVDIYIIRKCFGIYTAGTHTTKKEKKDDKLFKSPDSSQPDRDFVEF